MTRKKGKAPPASLPVGTPETMARANAAKRTYTKAETERQLGEAELALIAGVSEKDVAARVVSETGCSKTRALAVIRRVQERWATEDAAKRGVWKAQQMRRLQVAIRLSMNGRDAVVREGVVVRPAVKPSWSSQARFEEILAKVQGNFEPTEINVNQTAHQAVVEVFASISPEDFATLLERAERGIALAEGKAFPPPPPAEPKAKKHAREFDA